MPFELRSHTILLTVFGSRAYGTNTPESDVDVRGVAIAPAAYFHGFAQVFEQADSSEAMAPFRQDLTADEQCVVDREGKLDGAVYDIRKFMRLAAASNPSILEALFCREQEVRICTRAGRMLRDHRHAFLSRRVLATFSGYAQQQLRRIKIHRRWLTTPPIQQPTRAEFGLPPRPELPEHPRNAALAEIRKCRFDPDLSILDVAQRAYVMGLFAERPVALGMTPEVEFAATARGLGYNENFLQQLGDERRYKLALIDWRAYLDWQRQRNPERAELERRVGYDAKHASHLVRLLNAAKEILATGDYAVFRPEAEQLRQVRAGNWTYGALLAWAQAAEGEARAIGAQSPLPPQPDLAQLDALCVQIVQTALGSAAASAQTRAKPLPAKDSADSPPTT